MCEMGFSIDGNTLSMQEGLVPNWNFAVILTSINFTLLPMLSTHASTKIKNHALYK